MQTNFNSNSNDSLPCHWINWCRLCAKDDEQHNNICLKNHKNLNSNEFEKLGFKEALEKFFGVQITSHDSLPNKLCMNCLFLVSAMVNFNEYVKQVQVMFSHLAETQNLSNYSDLNSVRLKFKVTDYERDDCVERFLLMHNEKKRDDAELSDNSKNSSKDYLPEIHIKEEENIENNAMNNGEDADDTEAIDVANELNDSLAEEECPFERDQVDRNVKETLLHPQKTSNATENVKLDKIKKKRKRKKFKQFAIKDSLKRKSVIKDIKIEAACKECGNQFSKYLLYREHMQQEHEHIKSEKHWPCPACDKILLSLHNLERHLRIHVPLEIRQTFKCPDCDNRYTSNAQLDTHIRYKHKNEKPFICEECGLCLRTNSNLRQHMLIHTDLAPFECEVCKKKFKNKTRLKTHMDIHSPNKHVCNICGLQLNSRATLNRHFLVHSDEMQHKCDYCGKAFKRAKALKNHLLLHTGLKPYSCDFCERTFANGSNCRSHMKKMHPEELAMLEASGNKTHTKNIPKLETLKAVTKASDNLTPVVTKSSGCFAFGKKPKCKGNTEAKKSQKVNNKKLTAESLSSTPLDLQFIPLIGSHSTSVCLPHNKVIENDLSTNFDNIYQHLLKQNHTDLEVKQPIAQISPPPFCSEVSTQQHNPFYDDIMNPSIKSSPQTNNELLNSPKSQHSSMTTLTHDDHSNASSINGQFYGSMTANLTPGNFM